MVMVEHCGLFGFCFVQVAGVAVVRAFLNELQNIFQVNIIVLIFKSCVFSLAQVVCFVFTSAKDSTSVRANKGTGVREYYTKCAQK